MASLFWSDYFFWQSRFTGIVWNRSMFQVASFFDFLCLHLHCHEYREITSGPQSSRALGRAFATMCRNGSTWWHFRVNEPLRKIISPSHSPAFVKLFKDRLSTRYRIGGDGCRIVVVPVVWYTENSLIPTKCARIGSVGLLLSPFLDRNLAIHGFWGDQRSRFCCFLLWFWSCSRGSGRGYQIQIVWPTLTERW